MKILRGILIALGILIAVVLISGLFIKTDYLIEREIVINKPKQDVFNYVRMVKNQNNYNKWWMMDPNAKTDYRGTDGTVGFVASWDSKNKHVGKGEQETKNIVDGQKIDWELRFEKPMKGMANTSVSTESVTDNQTKVKWMFSGVSKYPTNVMNPFMDNVLGNDLQASLNNLKNLLENNKVSKS